jgi:hypothetical protein
MTIHIARITENTGRQHDEVWSNESSHY